MFEMNSFNVTGEFVSFEPSGSGIIMKIQQLVAGKFTTEFSVFVAEELLEHIQTLSLTEGDIVAIQNGLVYVKGGSFRIRISQAWQIQKISDGVNLKEKYFLGYENAEEKFM